MKLEEISSLFMANHTYKILVRRHHHFYLAMDKNKETTPWTSVTKHGHSLQGTHSLSNVIRDTLLLGIGIICGDSLAIPYQEIY